MYAKHSFLYLALILYLFMFTVYSAERRRRCSWSCFNLAEFFLLPTLKTKKVEQCPNRSCSINEATYSFWPDYAKWNSGSASIWKHKIFSIDLRWQALSTTRTKMNYFFKLWVALSYDIRRYDAETNWFVHVKRHLSSQISHCFVFKISCVLLIFL